MPLIDTDTLVRPTTAARILGCTRVRVCQLIASGDLDAVTIDGHRFVRRATVERVAAGDGSLRARAAEAGRRRRGRPRG